MRIVGVALALCAAAASAAGAETAVFDRFGQVRSLIYGGDELAVQTRLSPPPDPDTDITRAGQMTTWKSARFRQTATEQGGRTELELVADGEGLSYWIEAPRAVFVGGHVELGPTSVELPLTKPPERDFARAEADRLSFVDAHGELRLNIRLSPASAVALEDRWDRSGRSYVTRIALQPGVPLKLTLEVIGEPDTTPAHLALDAGRRRYRLDGIGGDYCFNIESPVTEYTLDHLKVGWARTEISLSQWEPEQNNDWAYLTSHDQPDSRLRHEFLLMQELQKRRIPYVASIWQLPEWLYSDPGPMPHRRSGRSVAPGMWDALAESLGSYLLYAKRQYGAEPDLFSFNEANYGVDVLLSPQQHCEAIKRIGAYFEKLGLKTKMLLGDTTNARGTHEYALAAANDPEAMQYVGAVAFHSWGGATPEQYSAWADLAEWLNRPLLVTELGVDAGAWRGRTYDSFQYGIREVRMYQQLLLNARPQGTMQWEFTADYGTVRVDGDKLEPTPRFWFVKHFTDLTPHHAEALGTASDNPKVLFTAFEATSDYTLHVANLGAARHISIAGIPESLRRLRAVRTSEDEAFRELPAVEASGGRVELDMPARALLTLTTLKRLR